MLYNSAILCYITFVMCYTEPTYNMLYNTKCYITHVLFNRRQSLYNEGVIYHVIYHATMQFEVSFQNLTMAKRFELLLLLTIKKNSDINKTKRFARQMTPWLGASG